MGNLVASRNHRRGLPVVQMNTFGMCYGAMFVALYAVLAGQPFRIDWSQRYMLSLAYLTLLGSVVAFSAFLTLLGRIGADRAGYVTAGAPGGGTPHLGIIPGTALELSPGAGRVALFGGEYLSAGFEAGFSFTA